MNKILIVEDELLVARELRKTLERNGFKILGMARTFEKALMIMEESRPSLVLLDIFLKGNLTGIDLAKALNEKGIPFIYISANSNQQVLEVAKTTDPYGFIVKPFREKDLLVTIDIAKYRHENKMKMSAAVSPPPVIEARKPALAKPQQATCENIIGSSPSMLHVFNLIEQVAPFDTSVLILGESGTGKEGVAQCIVQLSTRKNKPYIRLNCAAIPAELMESELFGYEKGAFTGAADKRAGKFEQAAGGTLLLDEIGEMALELQTKLLRVLQEKEIQRIGGNTTIKADVRILAATSKNLEKEVAEGNFRLDLYYRLLVFPIRLPPLRERKEDIPLLIDHFIRYYAGRTGKEITGAEESVLKKLTAYSWPGNIRELQHTIERAVLLSKKELVEEISIPPEIVNFSPSGNINALSTADDIERTYLLSVLKRCNFRITGKGGAAEILNMAPSTLTLKIKKLGIRIEYGS